MTEPTDAGPLNAIDLMRVVMDADNETRSFALRGTTNWAAHIGKAVQNAVIAKLWTPEQVAKAKEHAKKFDHWLGTTPQPTQEQAGEVPLTDEQRSDIATAAAGFNWTDDYVEAIDYVIDGVESLHGIKGKEPGSAYVGGIKGGQHGTE